MRQINYYTICEDIAHSTFIEEYLEILRAKNSNTAFTKNEFVAKRYDFSSKAKVLNFYAEASGRFIKEYSLDLLFIIADYDDWDIAYFNDYYNKLFDQLSAECKEKTVILLPVRAIEFWFWHLKWKHENPGHTRNVSIDNKKRGEIKKQVYGTKKPYKDLSKAKVKEIMQFFDSAWLCSRSPSFNHFHIRFSKVLNP